MCFSTSACCPAKNRIGQAAGRTHHVAGGAACRHTIDDFIGLLAGKTKKVATLEEISEAAAAGWAG